MIKLKLVPRKISTNSIVEIVEIRSGDDLNFPFPEAIVSLDCFANDRKQENGIYENLYAGNEIVVKVVIEG